MRYKVILLTGVPASGKSTISSEIKKLFQPIKTIDYGAVLLDYLRKSREDLTYENMRYESSGVIKKEDVRKVDEHLISKIQSIRKSTNVIIDSHAVTKEHYGYRVTPFDLIQLNQLSLDAVIVLNTEIAKICIRIEKKPGGRQVVSKQQIKRHMRLIDSQAITYGIIGKCPIYFIEDQNKRGTVIKQFEDIFIDLEMNFDKLIN